MASNLSWNLHGNDQLSGVLEHLDRTLSGLSRRLDGVTTDARQMGSALGSAEGTARKFGAGTEYISHHVDGLSAGLSRVIDKARFFAIAMSTAALAAAGSVVFMAVKTASANESAAISFELLLGSAEKAQKFFAELQAFAAATPFELPELRSAASRLLAVGTAVKDIIPLLRSLGDATAGMGTGAEGISRAVTALTQMQQKTKVTAEEMMQLTEAGLPAWATLAAFLKVDVATAMKMVEKRTVDATAMFQALEQKAGPAMQRLSGMMERQSHTLEGVWSTFKDNAGQALAKFAEPALPALIKLVDVMGQVTPKILDKIRDMGHQVGDIFKGSDVPDKIFNALKQLGQTVLPELEKAWNRILGTIRDNRESFEKLGRFVADYLIPFMGTGLIIAIDELTIAFQALIWVTARIVDSVQFMASTFLNFLGLMVHAADNAFGWIPGLGPKLHEATAKFDEFANGVMDKLNALNGTTVRVNVEFAGQVAGLRAAESKYDGRASGGPVWAGGAYVKDEFGPEPFIAATTGTVQPYQANGGGAGGGDQVLGTYRFVLSWPDGSVIHEELLKLKANKGLLSLGL
jgi:tape measure domain-containing protein